GHELAGAGPTTRRCTPRARRPRRARRNDARHDVSCRWQSARRSDALCRGPEDSRMKRTATLFSGTKMRLIVGALVALHMVVGLAGFVAPYDPTSQDRSSPYAPPTALHVMDASGELQ